MRLLSARQTSFLPLQGLDAALTARATTSRLHAAASDEDESHNAGKHRGGQRVVQHLEVLAATLDVKPELPDQLRSGRVDGIEEVVVVALEGVAPVADRDDAVQHRDVQQRAVVRDDLADRVPGSGMHDRQVAGVEPRLHADAVADHVARIAPIDVGAK